MAPSELSPTTMAAGMKIESERRKLITEYIANHMKEGVDYGTIFIGGRESKPSLFKPGSEKFLSLFKLTATFRKDAETFEMAGSTPGLFSYVCEIKTSAGNIVGEGRGAATLDEKRWTINTCIKIALKRAQVDAVLRMGALSDFFTQDLEDMVADKEKYDTSPVEEDAPVVVAGADENADKPWRKPTIASLKTQIKDLSIKHALVPLETKKDFTDYVSNTTGLDLGDQSAENLQAIIERLKAL